MNSKIILPVAELKPALAGLGKIIGKRTTLPVLGMLKVERTQDGWVTMTGTDLDAFVTVRMEDPAEGQPASLLVPHADLAKITKGCSPGDVISVEQKTKETVTVEYPIGGQTAAVQVESAGIEEFPEIPKVKGEAIALGEEIRSAIGEAMACASDDQTRYVLQGAYMDVSDRQEHHVVGTDGRHLYRSAPFLLPLKDSIIIPDSKFLEWREFGSDGEWQLQVDEKEKRFAVSSRRWRFISKAVEGNYPNWRQVIPPPAVFKTTVDLEGEAAKQVARLIPRIPLDPKAVNKPVGLKIGGGKVTLRGRASDSDKWTDVEVGGVKASGNAVTVYLNRDYLTKALGFGLTRIDIQDELAALRFTDAGGKQIVVMPVRIGGAAMSTAPAAPPAQIPQFNGNGGHTEGVNAGATTSQPTERSTMRTSTTNGNGNGNGNGHHHNGTEEKPALETALEKIETIKGSYRDAIRGLNDLAETLKQVQREQKSASREVQTVRSTLEKLQTVRI